MFFRESKVSFETEVCCCFFVPLHFEIVYTLHMSNTYITRLKLVLNFDFLLCSENSWSGIHGPNTLNNDIILSQTRWSLNLLTSPCVFLCIVHRRVSLYWWVELQAFVTAGLRYQISKPDNKAFRTYLKRFLESREVGTNNFSQVWKHIFYIQLLESPCSFVTKFDHIFNGRSSSSSSRRTCSRSSYQGM